MKFALFATGAVAATLIQRDAAAIESDIAAIQSATNSLDSAIKAISGPSSKNAVLAANQAVLKAINQGISDAKSTKPLTQTEAIGIATPITNLAAAVSQTVNDLISKKSIIVSSGLGGTTEQQLTAVQSASEAFSSDVTALVPSALAGTATELSSQILSALQSGVAAFKGLSDSTGSSSGSSSSAPASSASSAAASSASAPASSASSAVSSAVSSASSAVSSAVSSVASSASSAAASTTAATGASGTSNSTSASTPSTTPYKGAASSTVASFGGLVAAAVVLVAAL